MDSAELLHSRSVVVDGHNDLLMLVSLRPPDVQATYFRERWIPQLRAGGVNLQVLPVFVSDEYRPEGALRQTLRMIDCAHRIAEANSDQVALCHDGAEISSALGDGRIALVLALEGCEAIGTDVELFGPLFRLGVRMASFTHFGRTALADGSVEEAAGGRLTRAGVAAVAEMERLGMLIDVSHLSAAGTDHVLELVRRPIVATHSSAHALRPHHRNLTDERIKGIAQTGGLVGVAFVAGLVDPEHPTVDRVVDHILHVASVAGFEHVALGPDFVKEVHDETLRPYAVSAGVGFDRRTFAPGLEGPAGLPLITQALLKRGVTPHEAALVLGANWLRLLGAEPPSAP